MECFGRLVDDLVVHGAGEERVRMANDGGELRIFRGGGPEQRLEASGGAIEKKFAVKYFSHVRGGS